MERLRPNWGLKDSWGVSPALTTNLKMQLQEDCGHKLDVIYGDAFVFAEQVADQRNDNSSQLAHACVKESVSRSAWYIIDGYCRRVIPFVYENVSGKARDGVLGELRVFVRDCLAPEICDAYDMKPLWNRSSKDLGLSFVGYGLVRFDSKVAEMEAGLVTGKRAQRARVREKLWDLVFSGVVSALVSALMVWLLSGPSKSGPEKDTPVQSSPIPVSQLMHPFRNSSWSWDSLERNQNVKTW